LFWHTREGMTAEERYRWQWIRSILINKLAMGLPHINIPLRKWLLRLGGITIGKGGFIGMHGWFDDYLPHRIIIGDNCTISFQVTLVAHGPRRREDPRIIIEDDVYIGCNVTVLAGVRIGRGARIGAASVVTKDIPPGVIAAGNPCRVLREVSTTD